MSTIYGSGYAPMAPRRVNFGWIGEAWNRYTQNVGLWLLTVLILFVVPMVVGGVVGGVIGAQAAYHAPQPARNPPFGFTPPGTTVTPMTVPGLPIGLELLIQIGSYVWTAFLYSGAFQMALKQVRGQPLAFEDIFSGGRCFWRMLGFLILYGLTVTIGTLLCIVPGLLLAGLLLPGFAMIADGQSVGEAITRATNAMKADLWNAALFAFVLGLLVLVGALLCGLGSFVTLPLFWICSVLAYRDMAGMPGGVPVAPDYGSGAQGPGVWPPPPNI